MPTITNNTADDPGPWKQSVVIASVICIGLEYMVYRALAPVERGQPADTAVWAPIAIVYEFFGFAAAMAVVPTLWFLLMTIAGWQTWVRIKRKQSDSHSGAHPSVNASMPPQQSGPDSN
jgi:hypothetical protein